MITIQLLKLKTELHEAAEEYGHFSVDLQVTVYGRAVCYNCIATSIQNPDLVYTVAGKEDTILGNLRKELEKHSEKMFHHFMTKQILSTKIN